MIADSTPSRRGTAIHEPKPGCGDDHQLWTDKGRLHRGRRLRDPQLIHYIAAASGEAAVRDAVTVSCDSHCGHGHRAGGYSCAIIGPAVGTSVEAVELRYPAAESPPLVFHRPTG